MQYAFFIFFYYISTHILFHLVNFFFVLSFLLSIYDMKFVKYIDMNILS